jgi:glycogen operon protein
MTEMWPGSAFPLGATPSHGGTGFAVASEVADAVILCLFDSHGREAQLPLPEYDAGVWHGFVPEVGPGQRYGYRVQGPYDPSRGLRCNPAKLLLDPYAKAIIGGVAWHDSLAGDNSQDSAPYAPRSIVVDPAFDWGDDRPPGTRLADSVLYETHVKGITAAHPELPPELRGTYAGLAHPAVVEHLVGLGVTAVELLPIQRSVTNGTLAARGLTNYWGYDPIGFFAPHEAYSAAARAGRPGGQVAEFQAMVRALHAAGLEVLLDVVYNHTAEGNEHGPTLCHRGLDNPGYYRLIPGDLAHYFDTTGTGNSLDLSHPACLRMVLDSLRYWATVMHVDGFRFDLAATLAREEGRFDRLTNSAAPRAATTTPTARTTRSPGTTGRPSTTTWLPSPAGCSPCVTPTRCCAAATSQPREIWAGTPRPARPSPRRTGSGPGPGLLRCTWTGRPHPTWTNAGGRCSTTTCSSSPTPGGSRSPSPSPMSATPRTGRSSWTPTTRSGPQRPPPATR